jgi:hypothetical protein
MSVGERECVSHLRTPRRRHVRAERERLSPQEEAREEVSAQNFLPTRDAARLRIVVERGVRGGPAGAEPGAAL